MPSSFASIIQPIETAYARYAERSSRWIGKYHREGGRVYCGAGCAACCDMPIRVSLAEALVTVQKINPAQTQAMKEHARAVQYNAQTAPNEDIWIERHRQDVGFCPLLNRETGSCSQYEGRPTRCRDTFSAFPAFYCAAGSWESLSRREKADYRREVARTPATDGELHFIAPLEHLSEPIWITASRVMRDAWNMEIWGDFWTLTTLAADTEFMKQVSNRNAKAALARARTLGLAHPITLQIES